MKKILAFSGSISSDSINQQLATVAAKLAHKSEAEVITIQDFPAPFYSSDAEKEIGVPVGIQQLIDKMATADGFIFACPEYNGSTPAFFKNTIDWISRSERKVFGGKSLLLMSTSPGARGGLTVVTALEQLMPRWGAQLSGTFLLPNFYDNLQNGQLAEPFLAELSQKVQELEEAMLVEIE